MADVDSEKNVISINSENAVHIQDVNLYILDGVKVVVEKDSPWEVVSTGGALTLHEKGSRMTDAFRLIQVNRLITPYFYYTKEDWAREAAEDKKRKEDYEKRVEKQRKLHRWAIACILVIPILASILLVILHKFFP